MSVFRSFIAVDLTLEMIDRLEHVIQDLQQGLGNLPIRWTPSENIHLTLKFLGDVSMANVDMLKEILQMTADSHHVFAISIGGLGVFPSSRRPRIIWVGVEGPSELSSIQRNIDSETARLGYKLERQPYKPHLTLGRVSRNASPNDVKMISQIIKTKSVGFLGLVRVRSLHLFRSDLLPKGAIYSKVFSAPLIEKS
jgi:2'-5' RNA ligase